MKIVLKLTFVIGLIVFQMACSKNDEACQKEPTRIKAQEESPDWISNHGIHFREKSIDEALTIIKAKLPKLSFNRNVFYEFLKDKPRGKTPCFDLNDKYQLFFYLAYDLTSDGEKYLIWNPHPKLITKKLPPLKQAPKNDSEIAFQVLYYYMSEFVRNCDGCVDYLMFYPPYWPKEPHKTENGNWRISFGTGSIAGPVLIIYIDKDYNFVKYDELFYEY